METEVASLNRHATAEIYGLAKITDSRTVTEADNGLVMGAWENNAGRAGSLRNRIEALSEMENVDVSWDESAFPGYIISQSAQKINRTVYINSVKYNGPSGIPTGKSIVIGKINNNIPSYFTPAFPIGTQDPEGNTRKIIGSAQVDPAGNIHIQLAETSDWIMFIGITYIV